MTRWLLAFLTATVLLCAGLAAPGNVWAMASSDLQSAEITAGAEVLAAAYGGSPASHETHPKESLPEEKGAPLPEAELSTPESAWDGTEFLVLHPAPALPVLRACAPAVFSPARLPRPFIEGLQRPPRATGRAA